MSTAAAIKAPALRAARLTAPARPARTRAPALRATYADYSASQGSSALSGTAAARGQVQAQASPSVLPSPEVLPAPEATASAETEHGVGGWIAALSGLFSSQEVAREPWMDELGLTDLEPKRARRCAVRHSHIAERLAGGGGH